jgi:hypothetical protein
MDGNPWYMIWMAVGMAIGFEIIGRLALPRLFARRLPKTFVDWTQEVSDVMREFSQARLAAADAQRRLVELVEQRPRHVDPERLHPWLLETERAGLVPIGTFARLAPTLHPIEEPDPFVETETTNAANEANEAAEGAKIRWISGTDGKKRMRTSR